MQLMRGRDLKKKKKTNNFREEDAQQPVNRIISAEKIEASSLISAIMARYGYLMKVC